MEKKHALSREPAWPEDGDAVAIARAHYGPNADPDDRATADAGADRIELRMTPKPKPDDEPDAIDLEQDLGHAPVGASRDGLE